MIPQMALVMGDPAGIGPELMAGLLARADDLADAGVVAIGDRRVLAKGERALGITLELETCRGQGNLRPAEPGRPLFYDMGNIDPEELPPGTASALGGKSALENFALALDMARDGRVDAITFVPFNKKALRLGGNPFDDEMSFAADRLGHQGAVAEFNVVDKLWNARVTSHVALRDVADLITEERLLEHLDLAVRALKEAGFDRPRIAVAALNPHAGDGGSFGREEIDVIEPAVHKARRLAEAQGFVVEGPFPSDTVFVRARDGHFDAVLTMFHDQGQIAIKLLGFDRGITVLYGFTVPITTPAHGTAYDIAGRGIARLEPTRLAFNMAKQMAKSRAGRS